MLTLDISPRNADQFVRLFNFFREIIGICDEVGISPVLNGSLAVFAYTRKQDMDVHDVDVFVSEAKFPKLIEVLEAKGIDHRLMEWHVLRILRDDLKIEMDSMEYWMKDLPADYESLRIADHDLKIVSLSSLRQLYQRGVDATQHQTNEKSRAKHLDFQAKYAALSQMDSPL
jgi:hypothetical protein